MTGRGFLKTLQVLGGLAALVLLAFVVRSAWTELAESAVTLRPLQAGLGVIALAVAFLANVYLWRMLLQDLGARIGYGPTLQLWSFSNLGRYLPGKIWQVVGLVVVARDLGLPAGLTTAAAILSLGFMVGTGALVGVVLAPGMVGGGTASSVASLAIVLAIGLLLPLVWPGAIRAVLQRLPASLGCADVPPLTRGTVLRLSLCFLANWFLQGAAFFVFANALGKVAFAEAGALTGTYALAYVGGLLAVFAPGGIGVREGILGYLLGSIDIGQIPANVLAVAARLWAIAAELLLLAGALALRATSARSET